MNQHKVELAELVSELAIENEQLKQENAKLKEELDRISDLLEKAEDIVIKYKTNLDSIWSISYDTFKNLEQVQESIEDLKSLSNI